MSTTFLSPVSDESSSEGTPLRNFVDETIAREEEAKLQPPTPRATSPRQALLSHSSLHVPINDDLHDEPTSAIDSSRGRRSASDRHKRNRDLTKAASTTTSSNAKPDRELVRLLHEQEIEATKLRNSLRMAIQRMEAESRRVMDLEKVNQTTSLRVRELSESKQAAEQQATKAQQELRLYQIRLDNIKQDAERTQQALKDVEKQRDEAEEAARRARAEARKSHRDKAVAAAREEGRRLGFESGFEHARRERQMIAARQAQQQQAADAAAAGAGGSQRTRSSSHGPSRSASSRTRTTSSHDRERRHRSAERTPKKAAVDIPPIPPVRMAPTGYPVPEHHHQPPPVSTFKPPHADEDDADSETDSLHLPIRNLPNHGGNSTPGHPANPLPPFTSNGTPRYSYQVPPEHHNPQLPPQPQPQPEPPQHQPPPSQSTPIQQPAAVVMPVPDHDPDVDLYAIVVPPTEQLPPNQQPHQPTFPTPNHGDHSITTRPREEWVTATHFNTTPPHSPRQHILPPGQAPPPQPLPPPIYKRPGPTPQQNERGSASAPGPSNPLGRLFSFNKTKQQAASWYRSLSFRRKNKPVIDPVEEPRPSVSSHLAPSMPVPSVPIYPSTAAPGPSGPGTALNPAAPSFPNGMTMPEPVVPEYAKSPTKSAKGKERATDLDDAPSDDGSEARYGAPPQPKASWYQPRSQAGSAAPSVRDRDHGHGGGNNNPYPAHLISDAASASTRLSQLELISTPHMGSHLLNRPGFFIPGIAGSSGSGRGGQAQRAVKDKESVLSMIKEDPSSSRGNTPSTDRIWGHGGGPSGPGAVYAFGGHARSASTPTPVGHAPVYPGSGLFGGLHAQPSHGTMNSGASHAGRPSGRSHSRGLSIDVPDPDAPLLPPGAAYQDIPGGYHPYFNGSVGKAAGSGLVHKPSRISEKTTPNTAVSSQIEIGIIPPSGGVPEFPRSPPHTGVNHLSPYHTYQPPNNRSTASLRSHHKPSQSQIYIPEPTTYGNNTHQRRNSEDDKRSVHSTALLKTPKSTKSNRSRKSQLHLVGSEGPPDRTPGQHSTRNLTSTPGPPRASSISPAPPMPMSSTPQPHPDKPQMMQRQSSSVSLRSTGKFGKYDPNSYMDPAMWGLNGPGDDQPPPRPISRTGSPLPPMGFGGDSRRPVSRVGSVASGLSYM